MKLVAPALVNRGVCLLLLTVPRSRGLLSGRCSNLAKGDRSHRRDLRGHTSSQRGETSSRGTSSTRMHFARPRAADRRPAAPAYQQMPAGRIGGSRRRRDEAAGGAVAAAAAAAPVDGKRGVRSRRRTAGGTRGGRATTVPEDGSVWNADSVQETWGGGQAAGAGISAMQSLRHVRAGLAYESLVFRLLIYIYIYCGFSRCMLLEVGSLRASR